MRRCNSAKRTKRPGSANVPGPHFKGLLEHELANPERDRQAEATLEELKREWFRRAA
jgi:hypothetical protein